MLNPTRHTTPFGAALRAGKIGAYSNPGTTFERALQKHVVQRMCCHGTEKQCCADCRLACKGTNVSFCWLHLSDPILCRDSSSRGTKAAKTDGSTASPAVAPDSKLNGAAPTPAVTRRSTRSNAAAGKAVLLLAC